MNPHLKYWRFILVVISLPLFASCDPIAFMNRTYSVDKNSPMWGKMKPGCQLICTKRQFLHHGDYGELVLNPYWNPFDKDKSSDHTEPVVIGCLMPGDRLTVQNLQVTTSVTTAWLNVYTTDGASRKIHVIVPFYSEGGAFDDQKWARRGFRLQNETRVQNGQGQ